MIIIPNKNDCTILNEPLKCKVMDDKNKVFVFDKKELLLILAFMVLAAITSFSIGVKVGRSSSLLSAGITEKDQHTVQLKSMAEEKMDQIVSDNSNKQLENKQLNVDKTYLKLEEEFEKINKDVEDNKDVNETANNANNANNADKTAPGGDVSTGASVVESKSSMETVGVASTDINAEENAGVQVTDSEGRPLRAPSSESSKNAMTGKYTIQLGSYPQEVDAIKFADGFRIRGYSPILSEVRIPSKGVWYRVSLGTFSNVSEAKEYISKEESLFQGQDYVITEFN